MNHVPLSLTNQSFSSYLCKPLVVKKSKSLQPGYCKFVYIVCNENEICKIEEIPIKAPELN